jgi:hypothetical protein
MLLQALLYIMSMLSQVLVVPALAYKLAESRSYMMVTCLLSHPAHPARRGRGG